MLPRLLPYWSCVYYLYAFWHGSEKQHSRPGGFGLHVIIYWPRFVAYEYINHRVNISKMLTPTLFILAVAQRKFFKKEPEKSLWLIPSRVQGHAMSHANLEVLGWMSRILDRRLATLLPSCMRSSRSSLTSVIKLRRQIPMKYNSSQFSCHFIGVVCSF